MINSGHKSGSATARVLHGLLILAMGVLFLVIIIMLIGAAMMLFPNGWREALFEQITQGGAAVPSGAKLASAFAASAIIATAYFWVVKILHKVVKTLLAGDPFIPDNISRLRLMWILLAATELFRMVMHTATSVQDLVESVGEASSMIDIRFGTWFLVFIIAALAEVFRHGAELRRDAELTV